ncbi:glutathione S-transferase U17-like [Senna tora]|uniref:Glutathione S-transferase U17-like n=1 Tax=Senna tora TaxID=362788 RepID=A0A834W9V9_9FABA|nr:glutathione S-transferase U17-like [Senna tora]
MGCFLGWLRVTEISHGLKLLDHSKTHSSGPMGPKWFFSLKNILGCEDDEARKTYFEEVEEGLVRMEDALEKCSKGKAFFGGDQIGSKTPALVKWAENFGSDPNVKGLLPETEKLMEFAKLLQAKWKEAASAAAAK